jgi:hypothetical protein
MRSALAVPLLVIGALACYACSSTNPPQSQSQQTVQDTIPQSASLVRRLAEAADGYRDGKDKFVVAQRESQNGHHEVLGVFSTSQEAETVAGRAGPAYGVYGPFRTRNDAKEYPSSERVDTVIVVFRDGKRLRFLGDSVDALFWSLPAFDKFVVPYLSLISGAPYAAQQRELFRSGQPPYARSEPVASHKRGSL